MTLYICREEVDPFVEEEIEASDMEEAKELCREWAKNADWNDPNGTWHVEYTIREKGTDADQYTTESIFVDFPPPEPGCVSDDGHRWDSTHAVEGGMEQNPGVWGHGGGVIISEHCMHPGCAVTRTRDTWADDGRGGHVETVTYGELDDDAMAKKTADEGETVPEKTKITDNCWLHNRDEHVINGDLEGFTSDVEESFTYEYGMWEKQERNLEGKTFHLAVCEDYVRSNDEDSVALPIEDQDGTDCGYLSVYGWKAV